MNIYEQTRRRFAEMGIDTEEAIDRLKQIPLSIHCWQGDDVTGFENSGEALSGGIQTTGSYPGKARNFEELTDDFRLAMSLIPGKKRINLHASYAVFPDGDHADRDELEPGHFKAWADFARETGLGIDFNPTCFSHPMVKDGLTLSSPDAATRAFWVRHCIASRRIAAWFAKETGSYSVCNVWIPDGLKDIPADRMAPRLRLKESLDEVFAQMLDGVIDCVESKVFGIGVEAYTVGSNEFYIAYAASRPGVYNLLDSGHYHPTELISDKIPALLCFFDKLPLHISRPVRWDSDHVVRLDDELKEIANEIIRNGAQNRVLIGLDFFDASINRVAAWVIGARNVHKALLWALLTPHGQLRALQEGSDFTRLLMLQEDIKTLPFGDVWAEYCRREGVPEDGRWFPAVEAYENNVLKKRG